jgi:hypothetical protein
LLADSKVTEPEAAPAGNYTIRTMILEPVVIADEKVIVIEEESRQ